MPELAILLDSLTEQVSLEGFAKKLAEIAEKYPIYEIENSVTNGALTEAGTALMDTASESEYLDKQMIGNFVPLLNALLENQQRYQSWRKVLPWLTLVCLTALLSANRFTEERLSEFRSEYRTIENETLKKTNEKLLKELAEKEKMLKKLTEQNEKEKKASKESTDSVEYWRKEHDKIAKRVKELERDLYPFKDPYVWGNPLNRFQEAMRKFPGDETPDVIHFWREFLRPGDRVTDPKFGDSPDPFKPTL